MSAAAWPVYRQLLLQVVREELSYRMMKRVSWLLLAGAAVVLTLSRCFDKPILEYTVLPAFIWGGVQMWCGALLRSAVLQNRPEYACLVPQLRGRLMRLTAALFIGSSLLLGLFAWPLLGPPGYALLTGGLISVYIIFTQRYTWLAFAPGVIILVLLQSGLLNILVSAVDDGLGEPLATVIGAPLLLALGAWGLHLIFPRGGDRHLAWFKRYNMRAHALRDGQQRVPSGVVGVWRQALWRSGYLASLRRHSRSGGTPRRMLMYALGPGAHPGGYIGYAVLCTLATVVLLAALGAATSSTSRLVLATLMQWAVLFACLMYAAGVADGVRRYQTELGMFFLSARSPAAAQVNHQFGGALLSAYLGVWLAAAAGVALIDFFVLGQLKLRGATFLYMMMTLAWSCLLLRNYAAMRHVARPLEVMATTLLGMLVCGLVLALSLVERGIPWFWLGGVVAAGAALALRRRWQKLMMAPPVLRLDRLA